MSVEAMKSPTSKVSKLGSVFRRAAKAVRDGYAASMASVFSVFLLMWLRTTMSYQYVHGVSMVDAISAIYSEGGIFRFYHGLFYALLMMPLSRFGDIASNELAREFFSETQTAAVVTTVASTMAALWRVSICPIDTVKTLMQVHGNKAFPLLNEKIQKMGIFALWEGSLGSAVATWVGYYPWFFTHNFLEAWCVRRKVLDAHLSESKGVRRHLRRALVGLCSSLVSDLCSNAIRVVKTYKQTSVEPISYMEAVTRIVGESGLLGLFIRGLSSKLFSNALNAMLFTVMWKAISDKLEANKKNQVKKKAD